MENNQDVIPEVTSEIKNPETELSPIDIHKDNQEKCQYAAKNSCKLKLEDAKNLGNIILNKEYKDLLHEYPDGLRLNLDVLLKKKDYQLIRTIHAFIYNKLNDSARKL
jgi:hypothetical protein